jgi:NAD(P)-dependent dehydrogenase (short-subunit alcohol dehydrogenase family)
MKGIELKDSVVVVTRATDAVGRATAEAFAREGAKLVLAGRDTYVLRQIAARCWDLGAETLTVEADIADTAATRRLVNAARAFDGHIDAWISRTDAEDRDGMTPDVKAVIPIFIRQKRGVLINMTPHRLPMTVRAPLSARRDIHLCDVDAGPDADASKVAQMIVGLVHAPRPKVLFGANDDLVERALKAGAAFGMTAMAALGSLTAALQAAKFG